MSDARSEQAATTADNAASGRANLKKGFIAKIPGAQKCAQSFKMHSSEILLQRRGKRADIPVLPTSFECSRRSVFTLGTGLLFTSYISGCSALCAAVYMSFIDVYGGYPVELYLFDNAFLSRSPWRMPVIKEGYGRQPESCFSGRWCQHTERLHVAWRTRKAAAAAKPQARRLSKF
ncbi:hypothetical protein [Nitratireductor sp.]|uniref:hypothetical protein n=1 Tax=Nitratireductor sp. TaxID=1872084 RepID=UPI0025EE58EE|nr:hypothetical protein [Nitratireductor sp.]